MTTTQRDTRSFWVPLAVCLGIGGLAFLTLVPMPFTGDQALFVVFAKALDGGAVLYRDIWDIKQPGIFLFYLLAGRLFGFDEVGVHTLDLVMWFGFSALLALALRRDLRRAWVAAIVPAAILGIYAMVVDASEVTQVENVVGPLLFAVAWFGLDPPSWGRRSAFLSGLAAGVVLLFKLVFLPIVALVWIAIVVYRLRDGEGWRVVLLRFVVPAAAGLAIPIAALGAYIVANDLVAVTRFTYFEYPPQEAGLAPRPLSRFVQSLTGYFLPLAPFLALAVYRLLTGRSGRGWRLSVLMAMWVVVSLALFLVQPWWSYYLYLSFVPLAVLAVQGFDDALERLPRRVLWPALAVLFLPAGALGVIRVAESVPPLVSGEGVVGMRSEVNVEYAQSVEDVDSVPSLAGKRVYVLGNPVILYLGNAEQAVPVNGWSPEYWTDEIWDWVTTDLETRSADYLYISDLDQQLAEERSPAFLAMVAAGFTVFADTPNGTWFVPSR